MKLIVGLGNVGRKYEKTRHNVGFGVLDLVAQRSQSEPPKERFAGRIADARIAGQRAMLLWPQTMMNRSGQCVRAVIDFYRLPLTDLLVVCDDFNLPLGKLRFRSQGSAGGQKGLDDTIARLGSQQFARLRIGIGPVPDSWDPADFVLGRFTAAEQPALLDTMTRAAEGVEFWAKDGIGEAMNRFN